MKASSILALLLATTVTSTLMGQVSFVHHWDINSVNDTVGNAHGPLLDGAVLSGGQLVGASGTASSGGGFGNGLNLPTSAVAGLSGAFSTEVWYSWTGNQNWQTIFVASNGTTNSYFDLTPARYPDYTQAGAALKGLSSATEQVSTGPAATVNTLAQMVLTYDGANTAIIYIDGTLAGTNALIDSTYNFSAFTQIGIGGNSPFEDLSLGGSISDFRIY